MRAHALTQKKILYSTIRTFRYFKPVFISHTNGRGRITTHTMNYKPQPQTSLLLACQPMPPFKVANYTRPSVHVSLTVMYKLTDILVCILFPLFSFLFSSTENNLMKML